MKKDEANSRMQADSSVATDSMHGIALACRPKLVIFDCDGVLIQSEEITLSVFADLVNHLLRERHDTQRLSPLMAVHRYRGRRIRECLEDVAALFELSVPPDFEAQLRSESLRRYDTDLIATPGVASLLSQLTIPHCVATSAPLEKVKHCLSITGLDGYFEHIFSCYEIKSWKPDPAIFQAACAHFQIAPGDALVIEDSVPGVMAAKAANIPVLGFAPQSRHAELLSCGATPFSSMSHLSEILFSFKGME